MREAIRDGKVKMPVAEAKRAKMDAEYAAEVEKMKAEAEGERRKRIGKSRRGGTGLDATENRR